MRLLVGVQLTAERWRPRAGAPTSASATHVTCPPRRGRGTNHLSHWPLPAAVWKRCHECCTECTIVTMPCWCSSVHEYIHVRCFCMHSLHCSTPQDQWQIPSTRHLMADILPPPLDHSVLCTIAIQQGNALNIHVGRSYAVVNQRRGIRAAQRMTYMRCRKSLQTDYPQASEAAVPAMTAGSRTEGSATGVNFRSRRWLGCVLATGRIFRRSCALGGQCSLWRIPSTALHRNCRYRRRPFQAGVVHLTQQPLTHRS